MEPELLKIGDRYIRWATVKAVALETHGRLVLKFVDGSELSLSGVEAAGLALYLEASVANGAGTDVLRLVGGRPAGSRARL
jgi:hypothetical protein